MPQFETETDRSETRLFLVSTFLIGGMFTLAWLIFLARMAIHLFKWLIGDYPGAGFTRPWC
jgi:hypothetical protein